MRKSKRSSKQKDCRPIAFRLTAAFGTKRTIAAIIWSLSGARRTSADFCPGRFVRLWRWSQPIDATPGGLAGNKQNIKTKMIAHHPKRATRAARRGSFCQKKPRRLGRGFVQSEWRINAALWEGRDVSAQQHLTTLRKAGQINFRLYRNAFSEFIRIASKLTPLTSFDDIA